MYYYQKYGLLLHRGFDWQINLYDYDPEGKGDCIFRTAIFAITKNDPWILDNLAELLKKRIRWPEELNHPNDRKGLFHLRKNSSRYRSPKSMTRDPYIMFYVACYFLDREDLIKKVSVPFWLMRPDLFFWIQWLRTGKGKKSYEFWASISLDISLSLGMKNFALHLAGWMAYVIDSKRVKERLVPFVPHWNHLVRLLVGHPLLHLHESFIENYISREGYQWSSDEWLNTAHLGEGEIKLDKDVLNLVNEREK